MDDSDYQSRRLDHLGIVAGVCDQIGLVEEIDLAVKSTGRKVTVGQAVKATFPTLSSQVLRLDQFQVLRVLDGYRTGASSETLSSTVRVSH